VWASGDVYEGDLQRPASRQRLFVWANAKATMAVVNDKPLSRQRKICRWEPIEGSVLDGTPQDKAHALRIGDTYTGNFNAVYQKARGLRMEKWSQICGNWKNGLS